jgi:S-adenosylmethionine synthetase
MQADFIFSSESVTAGHPDKLCDRISDEIVARSLQQDRAGRVVAESAVSTGLVFVSVRSDSKAALDVASIARDVIARAGYVNGPFDARTCAVMTSLIEYQTQNGAEQVDVNADPDEPVATEQSTVFGFACTHTEPLMPLPIYLAHQLVRRMDELRNSGELDYLGPDGKTQVAVEFKNGEPCRIHAVTLTASQQQAERPSRDRLAEALRHHVIAPVLDAAHVQHDARTRIVINPEGPMVHGGPSVHAGLTGRKGGADTYGEFARRSDSALSGKDPFRVERIGAYAARHAAKNVVAARIARQCEVQLSYALGLASPVSVGVETFGTGTLSDDEIARRLMRVFDFRVGGIARRFKLAELDPVGTYPELSAYGHFGRTDLKLPWEDIAGASELSG